MNRMDKTARADGYLAAWCGHEPRRGIYPPEYRFTYDAGFQDGQVMRAVRSGELPEIRPSWPGPAKPRQMLAGDLVAMADPEYPVLREMEVRHQKAAAYYYLQYILAVEGFKIQPLTSDFYADLAREMLDAEKQVKVITSIDLALRPDETAVRTVGKYAVLSMGYGESAREGNLRRSRLAESLAGNWMQEPKGCAWCGALPIRDNLCQDCCGKWAEGQRPIAP